MLYNDVVKQSTSHQVLLVQARDCCKLSIYPAVDNTNDKIYLLEI
jgi:hypothetical protein